VATSIVVAQARIRSLITGVDDRIPTYDASVVSLFGTEKDPTVDTNGRVHSCCELCPFCHHQRHLRGATDHARAAVCARP
jgi:hypothetical protein